MRWLDHLTQDLRGAVRGMARYPVACAVAIISLAAGIGCTTATLLARDAMFLSPPPLYTQPDQLSRVTLATPDRPIGPVPGPLYAIWAQQQVDRGAPARGLAAVAPARASMVRTADRLETVAVRAVTPEVFTVVGVPPLLGRTFQAVSSPATPAAAASGATAADAPAVLSYRVWQNLFGARSDVVGATVWIDDRAYTVIGVMPERFWLSSMDSPIWTPLDPRTLGPADALDVIVRRAAGLTPAMLTEQLQRGVADYVSSLPAAEWRRWVRVADVNGTQLGNSIAPGVLWLVAASVLLTLLIAVSNVAILMIAQWTTREQEIGIRASLGASRGRLLRLLLTESVLVAIGGGLLGLCTMFALLGLILSRGSSDSRFYDLSIHSGVLLESAAVTLLAGFFAGIAPALYETRRLQANPLRAVSSDRVRQRWRHALVIFEIAVTVALLVVTGVMIDGYRRTMITDIGFDTHPLLSVRVERNRGVRSAEMLDLLRAMPGVASVAAGTSVPLAASGQRQALALAAGGAPVMTADAARISGGFFETLQVPMRIGRGFTAADFADPAEGARVAIVNATLANRLWPTRDPLGASLWVGQDHRAYQIIGVVADYSDAPLGRPNARVYLPLPREMPDLRRLPFVVRATGSPVSLVQAARQRVREQGSGYVASSVYTFDQVIAVSGQEVLVVAFAMVPLIAIGILLTAAGVYSVLSFAIARRGRELAVRVAIGATRGDLARLVVLHSARLVVIGTCLGVGATFWLTRLLQGSGGVFDSPGWGAFAVPVLLVLGVGALATWAPLRRVLRISPATLLRVS